MSKSTEQRNEFIRSIQYGFKATGTPSQSTDQLCELCDKLYLWINNQIVVAGNKEAARRANRAATTLNKLWIDMITLDYYKALPDEEKEKYKDWANSLGME